MLLNPSEPSERQPTGIALNCERGYRHAPEVCIRCDRYFITDAAVITVYALGELIGVICPDHLTDAAHHKYLDACRRYECEAEP
jgi:hypothetical protein